jgi:hypothetical protein
MVMPSGFLPSKSLSGEIAANEPQLMTYEFWVSSAPPFLKCTVEISPSVLTSVALAKNAL